MGMRWTGAAAVAGVLLVLSGCGGGSDSDETTTASSSPHNSAEFINPEGGTPIARFGREATEAERKAASRSVERSLSARAVGRWRVQCELLTQAAWQRLGKDGKNLTTCAKALEEAAQPLAQSQRLRADLLRGEIDALRVGGTRGYALYHGTDGTDYAVLLRLEDGQWKVDSLVSTRLS